MASQETPNYRLSRWAGTDRILVEEFNDNWDKIDTALKANADAVAAETAAREAASSLVKLMTATLDANTANMAADTLYQITYPPKQEPYCINYIENHAM